MLEDYEKNGIRIEWNEERVNATLALSATINTALTAWSIQRVGKQQRDFKLMLNLLSLADEADKAGDAALAIARRESAKKAGARAGTWIGRVLGKVFIFDTVIWLATGAIDLGLNLILDEEDQGIFADFYGGWSPVGALIGWGFGAAADAAGIEEEELLAELLDATLGEETAQAVVLAALAFYAKRISLDLEIDSYTASRSINEGIHEAWIDSIFINPRPDALMKFCEDVITLAVIAILLRYGWQLMGRMIVAMVPEE